MIYLSLPIISLLCVASVLADPITNVTSSKRGLVYIPNKATPQDDYIWTRSPSDLTWYYNYGAAPSGVYGNLSQSELEFVPMLWGAPTDPSDTSFLNQIRTLIKSGGVNVSHVLSFNEPDGPYSYGGSDIAPAVAAQIWVNNIIPLQEMGIRVGLPACMGDYTGIVWTQEFLANCSSIISTPKETKNCTYDFIPLHYYGDFGGAASKIGDYYGTFNTTLWITEYNFNDQDLPTTQDFFNTTLDYFDRLPYVERYSFFGSFRSSVSNVGPNAAMLSGDGRLTDIGAWYLGEQAEGVLPTSAATISLPSLSWTTACLGLALVLTAVLNA